MGFYSTLPSSSLLERLKQLNAQFDHRILDSSTIERELLTSPSGLELARRYFPASVTKWDKENPAPAEIFETKPSIFCESCGRDLLNPPQGIFALWQERTSSNQPDNPAYLDMHWACKGTCDEAVSAEMEARHGRPLIDAWEDVPDFSIPLIYLQRIMAHINGLHSGDRWSKSAFEKYKTLIIAVYPHIARHSTTAEEERIKHLLRIPSYLGGLGYEE
jgi:hypothetical protein